MNTLKPARQFDNEVQQEQKTSAAPLLAAREFSADAFFEAVSPETGSALSQQKPRTLYRILWMAVVLLLAYGCWQWVDAVTVSWQEHWLKGILFSSASALCLLLIAWQLLREWRLWRRLQRNRDWQQSAERIRNSVQFGEAQALCQAVAASLPQDNQTQARVTAWQQAITAQHSDQEQLQLFDYLVLTETDNQARQLVKRAAADTSLAVAISPFALADMLLVLWRSSRLVRELALLYGGSVGQLRSLLMLKRLLTALLWAGGSEMALDMASDVMSSELTAKLSARAGQGVIAGLLVARIGNLAQQQLRPLPVVQNSRVNVSSLLQGLVQRLIGQRSDNDGGKSAG
ncbi:TIGR01620 family protein [Chromatiaceae bacterium AAb-1]|nr:TIGR01620 family protein [Chromatiaceae bacterium AAb-1]